MDRKLSTKSSSLLTEFACRVRVAIVASAKLRKHEHVKWPLLATQVVVLDSPAPTRKLAAGFIVLDGRGGGLAGEAGQTEVEHLTKIEFWDALNIMEVANLRRSTLLRPISMIPPNGPWHRILPWPVSSICRGHNGHHPQA